MGSERERERERERGREEEILLTTGFGPNEMDEML
jgi:hypothetical protein